MNQKRFMQISLLANMILLSLFIYGFGVKGWTFQFWVGEGGGYPPNWNPTPYQTVRVITYDSADPYYIVDGTAISWLVHHNPGGFHMAGFYLIRHSVDGNLIARVGDNITCSGWALKVIDTMDHKFVGWFLAYSFERSDGMQYVTSRTVLDPHPSNPGTAGYDFVFPVEGYGGATSELKYIIVRAIVADA